MESSMDAIMALSMDDGPPTHTRHSVARSMGAHGIFHGRAPWEQPCSRPLGLIMDGAVVEHNAVTYSMAHTTGPWTAP